MGHPPPLIADATGTDTCPPPSSRSDDLVIVEPEDVDEEDDPVLFRPIAMAQAWSRKPSASSQRKRSSMMNTSERSADLLSDRHRVSARVHPKITPSGRRKAQSNPPAADAKAGPLPAETAIARMHAIDEARNAEFNATRN